MIIVSGFQPLTITTKHSILDVAAGLGSETSPPPPSSYAPVNEPKKNIQLSGKIKKENLICIKINFAIDFESYDSVLIFIREIYARRLGLDETNRLQS